MAKFSVTATADFAGFKEGQKLSKAGDIAAYFRAMLNAGKDDADEHTTLTDAEILATVMSVTGDGGDAESTRLEALEALTPEADADEDSETDEDEDDATEDEKDSAEDTVPAEKSSEVEADAKAKAEVFANSEALQTTIREVIAAGRKVKMGPLMTMLDIRAAMPDAQKRLALPVVGTSWKTRVAGDTAPVDRRRILKRGKNGLKPVTVSTYDIMFSTMPAGKELDTSIDMIDNRKLAGKPNIYTAWKEHDAQAELDTLKGDRTQGRTLFKRGFKLDRQFLLCEQLDDAKTGITVSWKKNKDGTPKNSRYGILIKDHKDGTASPYSIDQFLSFNVLEAMDAKNVEEKGGVFEALVQSGGTSGDAETPTTVAMDAEMFIAETGMQASYLTVSDNRQLIRKRFYADTDEGRAFMVSMVELHDEVHAWCSDPVIRDRYAKATGDKTTKPAKVKDAA